MRWVLGGTLGGIVVARSLSGRLLEGLVLMLFGALLYSLIDYMLKASTGAWDIDDDK